jgi:hypothetical protein
VDAIPLDRNGKVDLRALASLAAPSPAAAEPPAGRPAAPDIEELICEVWSEVLGTDDFGFDEAFFDVGGDSLAVAQVRRRLQDRLSGRSIPLADLYRYSTVQALADHLRTR